MDTNGYLKFRQGGAPLMRSVQGDHDIRLDGIVDLLLRARGMSVFDIGCNEGAVLDDFARNGASRIMGCDIQEHRIWVAREWFLNKRSLPHRFEVVDLTGGAEAMRKAFGSKDGELEHDIVLMLATYHKLKRVMPAKALSELMRWFGKKTKRYFGWRGYDEEIPLLDKDLGAAGLTRIHTSMISDIQPAAIWARK